MIYFLCLTNVRGNENWMPFRSLYAMLAFGKAQEPANQASFYSFLNGELKPITE